MRRRSAPPQWEILDPPLNDNNYTARMFIAKVTDAYFWKFDSCEMMV